MKTALVLAMCAACGDNAAFAPEPHCDEWRQWGGNAAHTGQSCAAGQPLERVLADVVIDPLAAQEEKDGQGDLVIHFQAPLVAGDAVYVETKGGTYTPCDRKDPKLPPDCFAPDELYRLHSETWSEVRYSWHDGTLAADWSFTSDWTPEPMLGFEPVFHPVIAGDTIAIPGAAGSVWVLDAATGKLVRHVEPRGFDADTYVEGPITERGGTLYYNALALDHDNTWNAPVRAWLVSVDGDGTVRTASYADLVPGAPAANDGCYTFFGPQPGTMPVYPPPPNADGSPALPMIEPCGTQMPGINSAPAFALDGTLYVVSHAQYADSYSYLVAVDPSAMSAVWARSLRGLLDDGCGVTVACPDYAAQGVDPFTNLPPAATVDDDSSSSPVVMADGTILYGALTGYNGVRGHLLAFSHDGRFRGSYGFGWDTTPAVAGDRVVLKDNHYFDWDVNGGPYYLTALDSSLDMMWQFQNTETSSCVTEPDGTRRCMADHPDGFEWCVNAPAIDRDGTIFANSEDGYLYAITADGSLRDRFFLDRSLGAAYTPVALDREGRIYALNNGHLIVVGAN